jgi:hypothetical protein
VNRANQVEDLGAIRGTGNSERRYKFVNVVALFWVFWVQYKPAGNPISFLDVCAVEPAIFVTLSLERNVYFMEDGKLGSDIRHIVWAWMWRCELLNGFFWFCCFFGR